VVRRRLGLVGTALLVPAVALFWRAHRDLGANWNPALEPRAGQMLATAGLYSLSGKWAVVVASRYG